MYKCINNSAPDYLCNLFDIGIMNIIIRYFVLTLNNLYISFWIDLCLELILNKEVHANKIQKNALNS
jgi:hypothetical protein